MLSRLVNILRLTRSRRPQRRSRAEKIHAESLESRQLLSAVTIQLGAAADTTVYQANSDAANGAGEFILAGAGTRGLVRFDLNSSNIPEGSTIIDAVLTLNVAASSGGTAGVSVHRLTSSWGEGNSNAPGDESSGAQARPFDATWQFASYGGAQWENAGGDFVGASANTLVGNVGTYEWIGGALIDDAQMWLDDASANFGWLLDAGVGAMKSFVSKDGPDTSLAPTLELTYEEPPLPPAFVEGRLWNDLNGDGIQTDLTISQLRLGIVNNNTHFNGFGGHEHWFKSEVNNKWYFLTEDGKLTRWSGVRSSLSGAVVGHVDPKYYLEPSLVESSRGNPEPYLNGWTVQLLNEHGTVVQTTQTTGLDTNGDGAIDNATEGGWYRFLVSDDADYTVRQIIPDGWKESVRLTIDSSDGGEQGVGNLDLRFHNSWYENAGGLGEKWLRDANSGWFYILPSGHLYRWNGVAISEQKPLTGVLVQFVGQQYFDNPHLLATFNPDPTNGADPPSRTDFGNTRSLTVKGRVWLDFFDDGVRNIGIEAREMHPTDPVADGETWFFDHDNDAWYIIDADGHPRYWGLHSDVLPDPSQDPGGNDDKFQLSEPWINSRTVELLDMQGNVVATTQTQSIDLNADGTIQYESERGWYVFDDVPAGEYQLRTVEDDGWVQTAPVSGTQSLAAELNEQLGLRTTESDFKNWGGMNERWVIDRDKVWYYILADGSFYQWDVGSGQTNGGLRGTLLATLSPDHYINLLLLTDPDLSATTMTVGENTTAPDILFGNHKLLGELL